MKQRSAQALVLYAMDLEQHHGSFPIAAAREAFLRDAAWQPTRRYLERLAATADWGEVIVAANLCFEPVVGTLLRRELGIRAAAANGDTVTPVLARVATQEWEWAQAWSTELVRFLSSDREHGEHNRTVIDRWIADWRTAASEAALALAPLAAQIPRGDRDRKRGRASAGVCRALRAQTNLDDRHASSRPSPDPPIERQAACPQRRSSRRAATTTSGS